MLLNFVRSIKYFHTEMHVNVEMAVFVAFSQPWREYVLLVRSLLGSRLDLSRMRRYRSLLSAFKLVR